MSKSFSLRNPVISSETRCADIMEGKPVVDNFIGRTMTNFQLMCHLINNHPSVLQGRVTDSFRFATVMEADQRPSHSSCLTLVRAFLNFSIILQKILCDTTLFPYCTDILLCAFRHLVRRQHKKRITALCCYLVQMTSEMSMFMAHNSRCGLSMSHLQHDSSTQVEPCHAQPAV